MTKISQPILGQVYMASRYYNAKKTIWEPFGVETSRRTPAGFVEYTGTWLIDNSRDVSFNNFREFDPSWVVKTTKDLEEKIMLLQSRVDNLKNSLLTFYKVQLL